MLLVCSKSTKNFFPEIKRKMIISSSMKKEDVKRLKNSEEEVIAVGGGAVIDVAKIVCKNPIVCYPTTAAGTCYTSHSVYWDGPNKKSISVPIPSKVIIREDFLLNLPSHVIKNTRFDAISHCLDSLWSKNKTKESEYLCHKALDILKNYETNAQLIKAGSIAGQAINICPTTILHSLSYPLTGFYKISHGEALGSLLKPVCDFMEFQVCDYVSEPFPELKNVDLNFVAREAKKYKKIFDLSRKICYNDIVKILN